MPPGGHIKGHFSLRKIPTLQIIENIDTCTFAHHSTLVHRDLAGKKGLGRAYWKAEQL